MSEIRNLEPKVLWNRFYDLTQIPRPSKKEEAAVAFLKKFGEDLGLETIIDKVGNVIIRKPATPGMENKKGIILQGHIDMVPQKNSDVEHDFEKDPIDAYVDGDWVTARGTTLGADNGMGVAAALAVLEATDLEHGLIEALITIDEETGMTGANGLEPNVLQGDILLNMDSEDEGELYVGCAGGVDVNAEMKYQEVDIDAGFVAYELAVKGLKGGHSGMDINIGRANSNKLMFRFFNHLLYNFDLKIASVAGGSLRNAIPRESFAVIAVPESQAADLEKEVIKFDKIYKAEYKDTEPDAEMNIVKTTLPTKVIEKEVAAKMIKAVFACPHGVERMSASMEGLVETSNNLAIVKLNEGQFIVNCLVRSSVDTAKTAAMYQIGTVFDLIGADVKFEGEYPGWKPNMDSQILKTMQKAYENIYNKTPELKGIHAGLECGILGSGYPHWDMISFGPTIRFPHSPDEKVEIKTVERFWNWLVETLKSVPNK